MELHGIIRDVAFQSQLKMDLTSINKFELPTAMDVLQQHSLTLDPLIFPHPLAPISSPPVWQRALAGRTSAPRAQS